VSAADLIARLHALDARLSAHSGRLRVSAPKGALSAELRRELASRKKEILASLRRGAVSSTGDPPIPRHADDRSCALSFAQERLWFLQQLEPRSRAYNLCRAMRVRGPLDEAALERSLQEIIRRHEALRAKFFLVDGAPRQAIAPAAEAVLASIDLRALAAARREPEARRLLEEEAVRAFDLAQGALLRARLIFLGDQEYFLGLFTHHLAADAWSMGIVARELWLFYESYRRGRAPNLAPPRCRYRDYALWHRRRLRAEAIQPELDYWRKQLADVPALDLPGDRPRSAAPAFGGTKVAVELAEALTVELNRLSRRESATLFMTLLAALQVLLGRWSGQQDFAVGAPVTEREHRDLEGVVGPFINTLALRGDLSGAPSFRALLARVRETCLDGFAHQTARFELLARELEPRRGIERAPLFQVMLVFQNTPSDHASPPGLAVEPVDVEHRAAQFDLSVYLRERAGRLIGFFEYSSERFDRPTIERMAGHFQTLLESIAADPDRPIAALPMLSAAEKRQVLVEWNDTKAKYSTDCCVHELFERQVAQTPGAVALQDEYESLNYGEINRRANRLARELKKLGVQPERRVALLAERSVQTIAAALAIFKAGGVYVPLDPAYPKERLAFMLADSCAAVLLGQDKFAGWFSDPARPTILLDDPRWSAPGYAANLPATASSENAAYIVYTSGSTGAPKGVVAPHRGALNRFAWMWRVYPFEPGEKVAQKTSLSFVDSIWEMFGALLRGVPTVVVPEAAGKDPAKLARWLERRGVTRLVVVPSLLHELIDRVDSARSLRALRCCFSSGEALSTALAARFRAVLPSCRLINLYGSSEVAGDVAYYEVDGSERALSIPIGRPIANSRIYLLDDALEPVPIGARGEIYVGGDNLARGYLDPRPSAEKFVADPFSQAAGARLYRTGDFGRHRADGNIEFLGRRDRQVKIRGVRVEPGEVEAALAAHPAVQQCLVTAQAPQFPTDNRKSKACPRPRSGIENPKSNNVLVAYVVSGSDRATTGELRLFLKERLPDSMIPASFVFLDSLPLLTNGKVDLGALPPAGAAAEPVDTTMNEPRNEFERLIAAIWSQVLGVERIGADDDFFELGGHSLAAAKAAAKLRDAFGRPVSVRDIFTAPTLGALAGAIENLVRGEGGKELPEIAAAGDTRVLPLVAGQEPLFLFSQLFGGGDFLNLPYAWRLEGRLDVAALRRAIEEIVRRHQALRAGFIDSAAGPRQFLRRSAKIRLPLIDLTAVASAEKAERLERIAKDDAAELFDLERPPLFRATLVRPGAERHVLLVTVHHIIADQESMGVFRRELAALYGAFSRGLSSPLPELAVQFADFARWQKDLLETGHLHDQIAYWRKQLAAPAPVLRFHRGRASTRARYRSARAALCFDDRLFVRIQGFAREQSCTPFMVLLAGLHVLLHHYTGARALRVGTLAANRGRRGAAELIGYFVNALVLCARIRPGMSGAELISQVRETCVAAYAHQDLPFERLEALLDDCREQRRRPPLYQVMLNYRNQITPPLEANGLTIASWDGRHRGADPGIAMSRLDLSFHLRELRGRLTGAVEYKTDLFDENSITRLLQNYSKILTQIVKHPSRRIDAMAP
jgi:amino acid adenylation domain-containing protein